MPTIPVTLSAAVVSVVPLDSATGRIVVSQESGTPASVAITTDGSLPVLSSSGVEVLGVQAVLSGVAGASAVVQPPLQIAPGTAGPAGRAIPTIRLLSAGTPTVRITW